MLLFDQLEHLLVYSGANPLRIIVGIIFLSGGDGRTLLHQLEHIKLVK